MKRVQKQELETFVFESVNKIYQKDFQENWDRNSLTNYGGEALKYSDIATQIEKLHIIYRQCGIQKGDRIALCSPNQANWVVAFLSAMTYGAVVVPLLHEFKPVNIHHLVNHSESKILFVDQSIWQGLDMKEMPKVQAVAKLEDWSLLYAAEDGIKAIHDNIENIFAEKHPDGFKPGDLDYYEDSSEELAIINYTSGTSGFSKGVMIPYRAVVSNILFARKAVPCIDNTSTVVSMLPCAHMYGMMFEVLYEFSVGAHIIFLTKAPTPTVLLQVMKEMRPNLIVAVPLVFEKVYKSKVKPILEKKGIRVLYKIPLLNRIIYRAVRKELYESFGGNFYEVILGGAAFNRDVEEFMHKAKFPFTVGYGMTECAPILAYENWDTARLYSCGRPARYLQIRIDSADPLHTPGEIQVKGPNVFLGYYQNEEATAAAFTEDGWMKTGDMGVLDEDNFLYIKGRCKCMILGPSGQNIYPEEIEDGINALPYVSDCLVIDENSKLVALVYPDRAKATRKGLNEEALKAAIEASIKEFNKDQPSYQKISRVDLMENDFERTPKKSIKRYLYQKN